MRPTEESLLGLVGLVYEAALEPARWTDFLQRTTQAVNGRSTMLRMVDYEAGHVGFYETVGYDPSYVDAYRRHFVRLDPYAAAWTRAPVGAVLSAESVVRLSQRQRSEYHNDYERPQGIKDGIGCLLAKNGSYDLQFAAQRASGTPFFDEDAESMRLLRALMPHLSRSVQIQRQLFEVSTQKALALDAFHRLRMGVVLADLSGRPFFVNHAAEQLLAGCPGVRFGKEGLTFRRAEENVRLQKLLAEAARLLRGQLVSADGAMRVVLEDGKTLQIQVAPLKQEGTRWESLFPHGAIALFLSRPGQLRLPWQKLVALHGMTRAEARLACLLVEGRSPEEAAQELGVSTATVRSQLKSIFMKTDARRQSELVGLLLTGVLASQRSDA